MYSNMLKPIGGGEYGNYENDNDIVVTARKIRIMGGNKIVC